MFETRCVSEIKSGINIFGYVFAEHGVGEIVRQVIHIARQAKVDFSVIPYTQTSSRQAARIADVGSRESIYDVNVICVNADTVPKFVQHVGREVLEGRYNIGMWAWEVEDLPDWMADSAQYLDEIWSCSSFCARAIAASVLCPVFPFAPSVSLSQPPARRREDLGLSGNFLFLFCFDFNSIFERKNALALIAAFKRAFPPGHGAELLIKTINGNDFLHQLERLHSASLDHTDINVVDGYLQPDEQQVLMNACDAYVSLHRSEGFGFTAAEAMALGKPVIATGYSGNMDFMTEENSYLVPYKMVKIGEGCDPYPSGSHWAEPSVEAAASLMRRVFERREEARERGERARRDIARWLNPRAKADFLNDRLRAIRRNARLDRGRGAGPYTVMRFKHCAGEIPASAGEPLEDRLHAGRSYKAFSSVKDLMERRLVRFTEQNLDPDLSCGSLDGAQLDSDGAVGVWGWAYNPRTNRPATSVALILNGRQVAVDIPVGNSRPDVAAHFDNPGLAATGWTLYVPPRLLSTGVNIFEAYALLDDGQFGKIPGGTTGCLTIKRNS